VAEAWAAIEGMFASQSCPRVIGTWMALATGVQGDVHHLEVLCEDKFSP